MKPPETLTLDRLATPIGEALLISDEKGVLRAFNWREWEEKVRAWADRRYPGVVLVEGRASARPAVGAYFDGDLSALRKVAWHGDGTVFQQSVWRALTQIPPGETWSYGRLAAHLGRPSAVRAVGLANGANPVALIAPCHRVIGSNGSLTGYAGGLERKRWLLAHEGVAPTDLFAA